MCSKYIDADNFKVHSYKFYSTIFILVLLSPIFFLAFSVLTPFHILGWYFKKLDDRKACKCLKNCPGCVLVMILVVSLVVFIIIFPLLMLVGILAMIIVLR